jgi:glycerate-2-kinase
MSTESETSRFAQRDPIPEPVGLLAGGENTAELRSDGGRRGELTPSVRSREHAGDRASESNGIWHFALAALLALAILGVLVAAMTFWLP